MFVIFIFQDRRQMREKKKGQTLKGSLNFRASCPRLTGSKNALSSRPPPSQGQSPTLHPLRFPSFWYDNQLYPPTHVAAAGRHQGGTSGIDRGASARDDEAAGRPASISGQNRTTTKREEECRDSSFLQSRGPDGISQAKSISATPLCQHSDRPRPSDLLPK